MAPLDWTKLMAMDMSELDDPGTSEDMYNVLSEFDPGDESNPDRLRKLFNVTQAVMLAKGVAAEVMEEQLTEHATIEGKTTAKKDQEIEVLKLELQALKKRCKDLERGGVSVGDMGADMRHLRDLNDELESQLNQLHSDLKEAELKLVDERDACDKFRSRAEEAEKKLREFKVDNDQLRDDMRDLQRQLDAQRETMLSKQDGDKEVAKKIKDKNVLLNAALDENRNLTELNVQLEDEITKLKKEMQEGQLEIEKTTDEYLKLKQIVDKNDDVNDNLRRDNSMLKGQVESLLVQLKSKGDADDEIMIHVNNKVEEWKIILADKDERIKDLQLQVAKYRDDLAMSNIDTSKATISNLTKAVRDKDKEIEALTQKLDDAAAALQENTELLEDVHNQVINTGKDPRDQNRKRLTAMQTTIQQHEEQLVDMEKRVASAEADAREKDKSLNEVLERMSKYEEGVYGLPEAVCEIKQLKGQINERDRNIEDLTQYVNRCEVQINDLYDEVEELRERLGLDPKEPINIEGIRQRKAITIQRDRALNRILQKEIERLEDERIELKKQIRNLAQTTGQKAVAMGLSADEVAAVDAFIDQLKSKSGLPFQFPTLGQQQNKTTDTKIKEKVLTDDLEKNAKRINILYEENTEMKSKVNELEEENRTLEKALREIKQQLSAGLPNGESIQCPALDKMLAAFESRSIVGRYDKSVILKAQVDNLTGRNDELRRELKDFKCDFMKLQDVFSKTKNKNEGLEMEVKTLREAGSAGWFQSMPLPQGMAVSSSDVITSLNEHLVIALQELSLKEGMVEKMEEALEGYRQKFAIVKHQQGLLYKEYMDEKKKYEAEIEKLQKDMCELQGVYQEEQVKIQEFDRLVDTLQQEEPEVRQRLADMTRKMTVLRVNEKALTRRYTSLQEVESSLRKENGRLRNDMVAMEKSVAERLNYLQRSKDAAMFKMASLQRAIDESVPSSDLDKAYREFNDLTEKYRNLLESSNSLVAFKEQSTGYQVEVKSLQNENNMMRKELEIEKEKLHTLEAAFEQIRRQGSVKSPDLNDNELLSIGRRMTTLEMKELHERQRAEHASNMYEQQKNQLRLLEDRNFELEQRFAELTRMNLDLQKVERELREDLSTSVLKSVSDADRKRIFELEQVEACLRNEVSKLKDVADVATSQVQVIQMQQQSHDKELTSLRQQLVDIQAQSDERTIIGKLHRCIVQLQISEGTAVRKFVKAVERVNKLEAQLLRTEQRIDEKEETIYHNRHESRNKIRHLKLAVQDLRKKFTGTVPLAEQEKFTQLMIKLQENRNTIEEDMKKTNEERRKVEDKLAELALQHKGLQELICTLQDGKGAQKVAEWHSKMEAVRLEDLRYKREIERLKQQIKFLDSIIKKHESEMLFLEEDKVRMNRDFECNELEWEHREVELERTIAKLEKQHAEIAGAASQFEEAVGALPDSSWPLPQQLEHAVTTIKRNVKHILDAKAQTEHLKKRIEELEKELKDKERDLLNRDRVINDLRLRLPATADRDAIFAKANSMMSGTKSSEEDYEGNQAVRIAQCTIGDLQTRLAEKEKTLAKYRIFLEQSREEMRSLMARHEEEMGELQKQLHMKTDADFVQFKKSIHESLNKPDKPVASNEQLRRLNELEDMVAEQDNSLAALRDKLSKSRKEAQDWKFKYEDSVRNACDDMERLKQECAEEVRRLESKNDDLERNLKDMKTEIELLQKELDEQKEANVRAPTATMKKFVETLKNDLAVKENKLKTLSKTLMELRADMASQAQSEVKANTDLAAAEMNVKKIVDRRTKELQDTIEEMDCKIKKLKTELKRMKDREKELSEDLELSQENINKKEVQLKKLKEDKDCLVSEVAELKQKVQRMSTMQKQKSETEAFHLELDELRRKNRLLSEELERQKLHPEKPYDQMPKSARDHPEDAVAKWEESKKQQKKMESLKNQMKEKDFEIEKLTKSNEHLRNALDRSNREKEGLESKLRSIETRAGQDGQLKAVNVSNLSANNSNVQQIHSVQDLKKRNNDLEDEVSSLRRQLMMGKDAAFEELQLRNKFLTDKLQQTERAMNKRSGSTVVDRGMEYRELAQREDQLQKQVIKLSEENLELRFEVEQANKDIPRLKERNDELQKYVEILKAEKQQMTLMNRSRDSLNSALSSTSSNIRKIGESGRPVQDLEKTIAVLKKVVEKTRAENEHLKNSLSHTSADQVTALRNENQALRKQLEELRQSVGASLSERYVSQQKGTAKIMTDHDKLRKDLIKEMDTSEKLRLRVKQLEMTLEKKDKEFDNVLSNLESDEARKSSLGAMDSKGWKSAVAARISEGKLKSLEEELERKTRMLSDVKELLRETAVREQEFMQEKKTLEEKVAILERFPVSNTKVTDTDVMRDYQLARLTIDRLENEKKEYLHELQSMRKRAGSDAFPSDMIGDEITTKLKSGERLKTENVELMTQIKLLQLDKRRLDEEVDRLKKELENFGPEFFHEIEDLKFNYHESVKKNKQYEEQLTKLSRQVGVNIPGL